MHDALPLREWRVASVNAPTLERRVAEANHSLPRERHVTLGVLLLVNEVESRNLHLDRYASLLRTARTVSDCSHSAASRRIATARCVRKFPEIVPMLADGRLNLRTLCILSRVLMPENSVELLARAAGAWQDEAERMAAEFGKPRPAHDRRRRQSRPGSGGQRVYVNSRSGAMRNRAC